MRRAGRSISWVWPGAVLVLGCGASQAPETTVHLQQPAAPPPTATAEAQVLEEPPPPAPPRPRKPDIDTDREPDDSRERARSLFRAGTDAYAQGDYLTARDKFQAAYDLVPEPALLFNIASAELRLGNLPAACSLFRRYVAQGDPADPRIQDVQRQVTTRCKTP